MQNDQHGAKRVLGWRRRIIALAVEPDAVVILGIFHGKQDWESDLVE